MADDSRIIALWLNSSANILQILLSRSETRGAFLEVGKYMLDDFLLIGPKKLSKEEKSELLSLFERVKDKGSQVS